MAVAVQLDAAENLIVIKVSGSTDVKTVANAYADGVTGPNHQQNMNALWDISGVKLSQYSIAEVRELARLIRQYSEHRGEDYKVAFVTSNRGDYQLLKAYSTFMRLAGSFRMRLFNDVQLAQDWITTED